MSKSKVRSHLQNIAYSRTRKFDESDLDNMPSLHIDVAEYRKQPARFGKSALRQHDIQHALRAIVNNYITAYTLDRTSEIVGPHKGSTNPTGNA